MGAGASTQIGATKLASHPLRKLPEQVEIALYEHEKYCIIIDPDELACRYLKYQLGSFISFDDIAHFQPEYLNRALVGAMRYGRTMTLKFNSLEGLAKDDIFTKSYFPEELLQRQLFLKDEIWQTILKPDLDPPADEISISSDFVFIICITHSTYIPPELAECMHVFQISDQKPTADTEEQPSSDSALESVAQMFGAGEIIRNSPQLVEAGFDGDIEEIQSWLDKGYHLESTDGRKHTALSEAACQGHHGVCEFLLALGADPNSLNDTFRSPLWRAAFSGHTTTCKLLLEAGSNPEYRDKVSMESAFDVARNDEVRELLSSWDQKTTEALMAARKRLILSKIEERIQTAQERENFARQKIRLELVAKAQAGDADAVKDILGMIVEEAEKSGGRPRASADCRSETGQSLLSIAAQHDHVALAELLLTHWKSCDKDRWDLPEGELSVEAKVFRTNVNSRDLKGWSCACIAVFHSSLKVLKLLLEHGADCNMRSQYNKNAHDLSKDELDAAGNVVTSRAEIREVILEYDTSGAKGHSAIFGSGAPVKRETDMYAELGHEGSPVVMQIEMRRGGELAPAAKVAKVKEGKPKQGKDKKSSKGKGSK